MGLDREFHQIGVRTKKSMALVEYCQVTLQMGITDIIGSRPYKAFKGQNLEFDLELELLGQFKG